MSRTGRPPILDVTRQREVCALLACGCSLRAAASYVGCAPSTISRTSKQDPVFANFIRRAYMRRELKLLEKIRNAGETQWRASAWLLERFYPDRYGPLRLRGRPRGMGVSPMSRPTGILPVESQNDPAHGQDGHATDETHGQDGHATQDRFPEQFDDFDDIDFIVGVMPPEASPEPPPAVPSSSSTAEPSSIPDDGIENAETEAVHAETPPPDPDPLPNEQPPVERRFRVPGKVIYGVLLFLSFLLGAAAAGPASQYSTRSAELSWAARHQNPTPARQGDKATRGQGEDADATASTIAMIQSAQPPIVLALSPGRRVPLSSPIPPTYRTKPQDVPPSVFEKSLLRRKARPASPIDTMPPVPLGSLDSPGGFKPFDALR